MTFITDDVRIKQIRKLVSPGQLMEEFHCDQAAAEVVHKARSAIHSILHGEDDRLIVIVGPCSIHDTRAAMDYAERIKGLREKVGGELEIIMRTYFEKPRTTVGWKGLMSDPDMNGTNRINYGLLLSRKLLLDINHLGVPTGLEYLDMITPQYVADLVSWGAIGARTTESQVHRQLASGLSCPVGFKNGTGGSIQVAVDAIGAAQHSHSFLSVTKEGNTAIVETTGNDDCHVILRGGKDTNYDEASIEQACELLAKRHLRQQVMIDVSHANSKKICSNQIVVGDYLAELIAKGNWAITGIMIESNIVEGRQDIVDGKAPVYGQSVTDACIGWDDTEALLTRLANAVKTRRGL